MSVGNMVDGGVGRRGGEGTTFDWFDGCWEWIGGADAVPFVELVVAAVGTADDDNDDVNDGGGGGGRNGG